MPGHDVPVAVHAQSSLVPVESARQQARGPMGTAVRAHIAGTVWKVEVELDDEVEAGEVVVILESMKMEMPVEAPVGGRVTAVHAVPGRFVEEGETLIELG